MTVEPEVSMSSISLRQSVGINCIAFSDDGQLLATADVHMNIEVTDSERSRFRICLASGNDRLRPLEWVRNMAFSPEGEALYLAAADKLWAIDTSNGDILWSYAPPTAWGFLIVCPAGLAVLPNGDILASFENSAIGVWNRDGVLTGLWRENDVQRHMQCLASGNVVGCDGFSVASYDPRSRRRLIRRALSERIYGIAVAPKSELVVVRSLNDVSTLDLESGELTHCCPVGVGLPVIALDPQEKFLVLAEEYGVNVVGLDGQIVASHSFTDTEVVSLAHHPSMPCVAIGCADGSTRLWVYG